MPKVFSINHFREKFAGIENDWFNENGYIRSYLRCEFCDGQPTKVCIGNDKRVRTFCDADFANASRLAKYGQTGKV